MLWTENPRARLKGQHNGKATDLWGKSLLWQLNVKEGSGLMMTNHTHRGLQ